MVSSVQLASLFEGVINEEEKVVRHYFVWLASKLPFVHIIPRFIHHNPLLLIAQSTKERLSFASMSCA